MRHSVEKNTLLVCQRGLTLVELIVSMVIISIALGGVLMVMNFTVSHSADPMIQHQAVAIAESYMEEILLQGYDDPDGHADGTAAAKEDSRDLYDNVYDYDGLNDVGARNQVKPDEVIAGLSGYTVTVDIEGPPDGISLNGLDAKKITVTVNHNSLGNLILTGYRTDY